MNLFNLVATLVINSEAYNKGIEDAKRKGKELGSETNKNTKMSAKNWLAVASAVGVVVGALAKVAKATIDYGGDIEDNAQKMNMSNDAYQKWSYAMKLAGSDISVLQTGMKTFTGILDNASKGQADALITLQKLGIGYEDLINLEPEEAFKLVVEQLQNMEAGAEKTQLAIDLFGKAGQELLPILNQESGSLDELFKEFEDLGLIMSDEAISKSAELGDAFDMLKFRGEALGRGLGESLYPLVNLVFTILESGVDMLNRTGLLDIFGELVEIVTKVLSLANFDGLLSNFESLGLMLGDVMQLAGGLLDIILSILDGDWSGAFDGLKDSFKGLVNFFIDFINNFITNLNNAFKLPDWGILGDAAGKGLNIPTIPRLQRGASFIPSDMYPAYLDYGERVLTRTENEEYTAFGGVKGIEALVNGISGAIKSNNAQSQQPITVQVQIGDKKIEDIVYTAVNKSMQSKGLKNLSKVGGY